MSTTLCIKNWFKKLSDWYYVVSGQEARDDVARLDWLVDELTIELDYQKYLAKWEIERIQSKYEAEYADWWEHALSEQEYSEYFSEPEYIELEQESLDWDEEEDDFENQDSKCSRCRKHFLFCNCDEESSPQLLEEEAMKQKQEDNEPPSGCTDLGNPGGTTFCY